MRIGKSTLIYFSSQLTLSLAGFIATFVIARFLGAEGLGMYSIAVATVFWLNIPAMAISSAITKRVSENKKPAEFISAGVLLNCFYAVFIALAIVAFGSFVDRYIGAPVNELLAVLVVANIISYTVNAVLDGQKRVAARGILQAAERIGRTGVQVAFIFLGWELSGLLIGHTGALIVASILGIVLFEIQPSPPSYKQFMSLLEYARYSWLGTLKTRAFAWMDTIILAFFVPSTLIGIYEAAWQLASILALISLSVQRTLFPELSELSVNELNNRIHHLINEGLVYTGVFSIPGLFGVIVLGDRVLMIYSPEFSEGALILVILVVARTVSSYGSQFLSAINAMDRPDITFKINLSFVILNVILNIILISRFGWYGAAFATTISAILPLFLGYFAISDLIGRPSIPSKEIFYQIIAAVVMALSLLVISESIPKNNITTLVLVAAGSSIYTTMLLLMSNRVRKKAEKLSKEIIDMG